MSQVREGRVVVLAVYKLDRFGRSLQHLAQLIGELKAHGTALIATSQGIDTSETNPAGELQMHVLAAVAQFERRRFATALMLASLQRGNMEREAANRLGDRARWTGTAML